MNEVELDPHKAPTEGRRLQEHNGITIVIVSFSYCCVHKQRAQEAGWWQGVEGWHAVDRWYIDHRVWRQATTGAGYSQFALV